MGLGYRTEQGFSLVEMMVAVLLFAVVSAAGVMILSGYQDGQASMKRADARLNEIEAARALIRADLLAVVRRPLRDAYGAPRPGFEASRQLEDGILLRLVRSGNMGAMLKGGGSALDRVEYLLENGMLIRRTYERTNITPETKSRDRVLLSGITDIALRFENDGVWLIEWEGAALTSPLPRLVEFDLQFAEERALGMTFLVGGLV